MVGRRCEARPGARARASRPLPDAGARRVPAFRVLLGGRRRNQDCLDAMARGFGSCSPGRVDEIVDDIMILKSL